LRGTEFYIVEQPLVYQSYEQHTTFVVPRGVKTDLASIPAIIKFWMDDDGGFIRDAAVLHDFLYSNKSDHSYPEIDRKKADNILIEAMTDLGASWIKIQSVYWALRIAGGAAYKKDNEDPCT
jgi:hypothetical protein